MLLLWLGALATLAGLAAIALALVSGALVWLRHRRVPLLAKAIGGGGLLVLLGGSLILAAPRIVKHTTTSAQAFEQALGVPPPVGLGMFKAAVEPGFDFRLIYVAMDRGPAADRLLRERFASHPRAEESDLAASLVDGGDAPDWWHGAPQWVKRNTCAGRSAYELHDWSGWQSVVVVDCPAEGRRYLLFEHGD